MRKHALIESYLDQTLTTPGGGQPPAAPGFVFGTVTYGDADWNTLHAIQSELIDRLILRGIDAESGYAVGFLRTFVEPVVYATGMDSADALGFARRAGLEYYVERTPDRVYVLSRKGRRVGEAEPCYAEGPGVCVMPNPDPGQVCRLRRRPYGRHTLNASLEWRRDRVRLIAALGCDTCEVGQLRFLDGPGVVAQVVRVDEPRILLDAPMITRYTARLEVPHAAR